MTPPQSRLFRSFWLGGFESACHINRNGIRLDLVCATGHDIDTDADYARARGLGLRTVRESVRWPVVDRGGRLHLSTVRSMLQAARRQQVQIVWTLCHYGWPDDLDLLAPAFVDRFARYCGAVARMVADYDDAVPFYSPINEISFFAWAAGEVGYIHPFARNEGSAYKRQLVRAAIAAIEAIRAVDPRARIIHTDPLIHVVPPRHRPDLARAAADQRAAQFEAWDMLAGGMHADLGGHPRYLDIVGGNFYYSNQWEYPDRRLGWDEVPRDHRWRPLRQLLAQVHARYDRPMLISETSHFGAGRVRWVREVAEEARAARSDGVPLEGICLYPVLDRPDWDDAEHWHRSGIWDLHRRPDGGLDRVPCLEYLDEVRRLTGCPEAQDGVALPATASGSRPGTRQEPSPSSA